MFVEPHNMRLRCWAVATVDVSVGDLGLPCNVAGTAEQTADALYAAHI
jgi:hypothetical protein